jgi:hypothetical protein
MMPLVVEAAWTRIGYAVWQLQTVEDTLVAHHVMLYEVEVGCEQHAFETAIDRRRGQTLGTLLKLPGFETSLSVEIRGRLISLLAERNWLLHRSRREVHVELNTEAGASSVLARISAIGDDATILAKSVQRATEAGLAKKGISPEQITRNADAILRAWDSGRRHPGEIGRT